MAAFSLDRVSLPVAKPPALVNHRRPTANADITFAFFQVFYLPVRQTQPTSAPSTRALDPGVNRLRRDTPCTPLPEFNPHPASDLVRRPSLPKPVIHIQPQVQIPQFKRPMTGSAATLGQPICTLRAIPPRIAISLQLPIDRTAMTIHELGDLLLRFLCLHQPL